MKFVGDVHGHIDRFLPQLTAGGSVFQLGDMGLGFEGVYLPAQKNLSFIRGNHDDPALCAAHKNYAGEFGYLSEERLFYVGGAYSIDHDWRRRYMASTANPAIWWPDEELSAAQLQRAYELYVQAKPRVVASHDCPDAVRVMMLKKIAIGFRPEKDLPSRTAAALQRMLEAHAPEVWLFGHYHIDADFQLGATRFICLNELSSVEIALND